MDTAVGTGRGWRSWWLLGRRRAERPAWERGEALRLCFVVDTGTLGGPDVDLVAEPGLSGCRRPPAPEAR